MSSEKDEGSFISSPIGHIIVFYLHFEYTVPRSSVLKPAFATHRMFKATFCSKSVERKLIAFIVPRLSRSSAPNHDTKGIAAFPEYYWRVQLGCPSPSKLSCRSGLPSGAKHTEGWNCFSRKDAPYARQTVLHLQPWAREIIKLYAISYSPTIPAFQPIGVEFRRVKLRSLRVHRFVERPPDHRAR